MRRRPFTSVGQQFPRGLHQHVKDVLRQCICKHRHRRGHLGDAAQSVQTTEHEPTKASYVNLYDID